MRADIEPTEDQLRKLATDPHEGPIVMVNLLKYRKTAEYAPDAPEAAQRLSGREAYERYGTIALPAIGKVGGNIVWAGKQRFVAVGGADDEWDDIVCVRYPSRQAFLTMVQDDEYRAGIYHRDAGLERTALLCCEAGMTS
jgi:uncharacterized protein (DUF1330 family)